MYRLLLLFTSAVLCASAVRATAENDLTATVTAMARVGRAFAPTFSPDGKEIAYLTDLSGLPQVWVVPASGGYPRQVTALTDPVGGVRWSPQGDWLAISVLPVAV